MLNFFAANWYWILFLGGMFFMHSGHGGHGGGCGGGHGSHGNQQQGHAQHGGDRSTASTPASAPEHAHPVQLRKPPAA